MGCSRHLCDHEDHEQGEGVEDLEVRRHDSLQGHRSVHERHQVSQPVLRLRLENPVKLAKSIALTKL